MRHDAWLHLLHNAHDVVHHDVGKVEHHLFLHLAGYSLGMVYGVGSSRFIGHEQAAGAELHSAKIAHHDDEDVGKLVLHDLSENGFACRAAGLAVVVGSEEAAVGPEHEGIAHMPGVVEALAIGLHDFFNLFFGFYMMCEGVKLAALLAVEAFGWG